MPLALHPSTVAGCSISLLFSIVAFAWASLMSGREPPMEVKQLITFLIIIIDAIILFGYREGNSEVACQIITVMLTYLSIALLIATFLDHYYNYLEVCKRRDGIGVVKTTISGILLPLVTIPIVVVIGIYAEQSTIRDCYLLCWNPDAVVGFTSSIVCIFIAASIVLCFSTLKAATQRFRVEDNGKTTRKYRFARYKIGVSFTMTLLTSIVWLSVALFAWYPRSKIIHLMFSLAISIQGIFGFFFYCVMALELGIFDESFPRIRSIVEKVKAHQSNMQDPLVDAKERKEKESIEEEDSLPITSAEHKSNQINFAADFDVSLNNLSAAQNEIEDEYSQRIFESTHTTKLSSVPHLSDQVSSLSFSKLSSIGSSDDNVPEPIIKDTAKPKTMEMMRMKPSGTGLPNMNELEALFNNPELVSSYGRERMNSDISASTVTVNVP